MLNIDIESQPVLVKVILAPTLGALFVIFLPVIGFYLVGKVLITKLLRLNAPYAQGNEPSANHENQ